MSTKYLFISNGKWVEWAQKSLFAGLAHHPSPRRRLLHLGEPESFLLINAPFAAAKGMFTAANLFDAANPRVSSCSCLGSAATKPSFAMANCFAEASISLHCSEPRRFTAASKLLHLINFFFTLFLPSLCLIFLLIQQNISKWRIRAFLYDIGANLAFMLHKTHENHTTNANKIHTYQIPPNLTFCLSLSKETTHFPYSKLTNMLSMKLG